MIETRRRTAGESDAVWQPPKRGEFSVWPRIRRIGTIVASGLAATLTGGYTRWVTPFQVQFHDVPLPMRDLPPSFQGFRIAHLSDLHVGESTPLEYLSGIVQGINERGCDLVCVTGDLVTSSHKHVQAAADLLGRLNAPVAVSFGNHDYAAGAAPWQSSSLADELQSALASRGCAVLRNQAMPIEREDGRIWVVGLEDWWSGRFSPRRAFAQVPPSEPAIALSHNPDSVSVLDNHGPQWILCGHTHGGQVRLPWVGPLMLPVKGQRLDQGMFHFRKGSAYVSRGVGFRVQVRFRCPPEVPFLCLMPAESKAGQNSARYGLDSLAHARSDMAGIAHVRAMDK